MIVGTVGAFFTALSANHRTLVTTVAAAAQNFHAIGTFAAFRAVFAAGTLKTEPALTAELVVRAVLAFLAAFRTNDSAVGAAVAAGANIVYTIGAHTALFTEKSFAADALHAGSAVAADFIISAVFAFLTALRTNGSAVGAAVAAGANLVYTIGAYTAFFAEEFFAADAVYAGSAVAADFIISAVFTFLAAFRTNGGTLVTAVAAAAQNFHTFAAFAALGTEFSAGTVETALTLTADLVVRTVLAFFAARHTDDGTFRASVAAGANLFDTVFAISALGAVIALAADAAETNAALDAQLILGAGGTFFTALSAYVRTLRAALAAGADVFHAHLTQAALGTVIAITAAAIEADPTIAAELIVRTVLTQRTALGAYNGTFRATLTASDAHVIHAEFAKVTIQTVVAVTTHTVKTGSAIFANAAVYALFTFFFA